MNEYNEVQEEYRDRCKDRIQRQLKYSKYKLEHALDTCLVFWWSQVRSPTNLFYRQG